MWFLWGTNWISLSFCSVTLHDSCEVWTESRFQFVVVMLCDSCEVRTESLFHFVVVTLCDSCEVRTESRFHFVVLSTLLQDILHHSHHLLNVLLQIANKLGLSNKKKIIPCSRIYQLATVLTPTVGRLNCWWSSLAKACLGSGLVKIHSMIKMFVLPCKCTSLEVAALVLVLKPRHRRIFSWLLFSDDLRVCWRGGALWRHLTSNNASSYTACSHVTI
jgi:hypothetical protein